MQNLSIAELAHEEFECAAVKNKYIADSQSQYVGFVNRSVTDCTEVVSIMAECDMLEKIKSSVRSLCSKKKYPANGVFPL